MLQSKNINPDNRRGLSVGAGGRTRTGTVSLPTDFESVASANFTTPAHIYLNILAQNFAFGNN